MVIGCAISSNEVSKMVNYIFFPFCLYTDDDGEILAKFDTLMFRLNTAKYIWVAILGGWVTRF